MRLATDIAFHKPSAATTIKTIKKSITKKDKISLYKGMLLTRITDNMLKEMWRTSQIKCLNESFQGKGFRSLGQEAIFGAGYFLKRSQKYHKNEEYLGDVASPLIRDLGVYLCFSNNDVKTALNAQAGKNSKPTNGRDLHLGDFSCGMITPAAPLALSTCTLLGYALSFKLKGEKRVAISFIGEGGSSLGEWHEAINFASVKQLPMIFCIENNQTALSTKVSAQCRTQSFADKALGYGIPGITIDGNNVEEVASAFKYAADIARAGNGPILIELTTMRMCGHAHHDDMMYLGTDFETSLDIKHKNDYKGYVNTDLYNEYAKKDPLARYEKYLLTNKILSATSIMIIKKDTINLVEGALNHVKDLEWATLSGTDESLVFKKPLIFLYKKEHTNYTYDFSSKGITYIKSLEQAIKITFETHSNCLMIGEDIAFPYGNAFKMFSEIMHEFPDRFINTPISESAIVGACVGMALNGMVPIGEIQFNDFIACAMNQVANNVAKTYFRLNKNLPLVLRMPYGGLRRAGPYHSQDTSPWFYRCFGLKIFAPSTPLDAYRMFLQAVNDPDPVLFYEHIALYRDPTIKQEITYKDLGDNFHAEFVKKGHEISLITYGAYVHLVKKASDILDRRYGISAEIIDLRYLNPLDIETTCESIKKCSRSLLIGEDSRSGSILESLASKLNENVFCYLDAPIKVLGSRDIPIPYAPRLEDDYLINIDNIVDSALKLCKF